MKRQALSEIWATVEQDLLQGPFEHIQRFLDPFSKTYRYFTETLVNIQSAWLHMFEGLVIICSKNNTVIFTIPSQFIVLTICTWNSFATTGHKLSLTSGSSARDAVDIYTV